eukprot:466314-Amphidinium_carterae.1
MSRSQRVSLHHFSHVGKTHANGFVSSDQLFVAGSSSLPMGTMEAAESVSAPRTEQFAILGGYGDSRRGGAVSYTHLTLPTILLV